MAYNGWTNKETWLVNLWLGDMLQCDLEDGQEIDASYVEVLVDELVEHESSGYSGFLTDMLNCALGEINYHEIASHYEIEESE